MKCPFNTKFSCQTKDHPEPCSIYDEKNNRCGLITLIRQLQTIANVLDACSSEGYIDVKIGKGR